MMNKKQVRSLIKKWGKALESGRYKQGFGSLVKEQKVKSTKTGQLVVHQYHCCLGVLCRVARLPRTKELKNDGNYGLDFMGKNSDSYLFKSSTMLPADFATELGISLGGNISVKYRKKIAELINKELALLNKGPIKLINENEVRALTTINDTLKIPFSIIAKIVKKYPQALSNHQAFSKYYE